MTLSEWNGLSDNIAASASVCWCLSLCVLEVSSIFFSGDELKLAVVCVFVAVLSEFERF